MTIIKHRPRQNPEEGTDKLFRNGDAPFDAAELEDEIYDPIAQLTHRPEFSLARPARLRRPVDDGLDIDDSLGARSLARKFAPRAPSRDPRRDRWSLPSLPSDRGDDFERGRRALQPAPDRSSGKGRELLKGFVASILIVIGMVVVFSFAQPLSGLLPKAGSDAGGDTYDASSGGVLASGDQPADVASADGARTFGRSIISSLQEANAGPALANASTTDERISSEARKVGETLSGAQIDQLLTRGEALLQRGDMASARLLFLRVAAAGDRRGAKGVAMTYDPAVYERLPVVGLAPDRAQAEIWYRKAREDTAFVPSDQASTGRSVIQAGASGANKF